MTRRAPRILLMGAPHRVLREGSLPFREKFLLTGSNTGNLLIGHGLVQHLQYSTLTRFDPESMDAGRIRAEFDLVVVAAANFLYPGFDFDFMREPLEKADLPVVMVGLGAQAPAPGRDMGEIPRGTWRLVEIAAERSTSVGVRGENTAEILSAHGIKNVRVVGCPSLYTHRSPTLSVRKPAHLDLQRVVINGSRNVVQHGMAPAAASSVERALVHFAVAHGVPYVLQNEEPELQLVHGEPPSRHASDLAWLGKDTGIPAETYARYFQRHGRSFFSAPAWFDWIASRSFSLGTRLHGNIAALINGVPAVVIAHDARTLEICELAAIPHVRVNEVGTLDVPALYERADVRAFETRYRELVTRYVEFLEENRVAHTFDWAPARPPAA